MTVQPADSREASLLLGLQALLQPLTALPGTLGQLPPAGPDETWALVFTQGATDPFGRWGQGVLLLQSRGPRGDYLTVHASARPLVRRLTGASGLALPGGVAVNTADHSGSSSGPDSLGRTVRTDSFTLDLDYQA